MKVATLMSRPVHTARRETPLADIVRTMMQRRISAVPVVDDAQRMLGVVTLSDLVPQVRVAPTSFVSLITVANEYVDDGSITEAYARIATQRAEDVMREPVATVAPETDIGSAARIMAERDITALPVVQGDGVLVGIVTRTDVVRMAVPKDEA